MLRNAIVVRTFTIIVASATELQNTSNVLTAIKPKTAKKKNMQKPAKCALCGDPHPTNYSECSKIQRMLNLQNHQQLMFGTKGNSKSKWPQILISLHSKQIIQQILLLLTPGHNN
ncbi:hypothetical protein NPIL_606191 [Nephila pilipes]|uniref:Uncharacterized protein n=1 Tax=Nephila pilipes TaxID=299642 RepID=A0A8X6U8I8_NEPPI|nr:hypothetical protein NPIL_606191 [Nephila pilipes]